MSGAELPPPYSLADEQQPGKTPQPSVRLKPSASPLRSCPGTDHPESFHLRPEAGPSSNIPLSSQVSASDESLSPLDLSAFKAVTKSVKRPLVTAEQIKTHLRLLRAFRLFQEKVEDLYSDPDIADVVPSIGRSIGAKGRWLWFLEMAVERFRRWLMLLATSEGHFVIPPVDVWLIWHTYMLNPMWYMEDCERLWLMRPLRNLRENPIDLAASMGDDVFNYRPTIDKEGFWEADLEVECPRCERPINTSFVNTEETGIAQVEFITVCPHCDTLVTRESLGVAKFIRDIILNPDDKTHVQMYGKGVYLPGSLLLPSGNFQTSSAFKTKSNLRYLQVFRDDDSKASGLPYHGIESWKKAIGERLRYSAVELRKNIDKAGVGAPMIRRIMGAYVDGKPFSVELVAAAMRQSTFTEKIEQLGWLAPGFFENSESALVLKHCILRYYGFLTLIGTDTDRESFFVPTLDIDLAWHTHQLSPENYPKDCRSIAWRFIDHDDQIEEHNLAKGLDVTTKAWQTQFGLPYMYCGCPQKEITVAQRLSRVGSAILPSRNRVEPPTKRDDCYAATHASEHNSVHIVGRSERGRNYRVVQWGRRREKEGERIGKGKWGSKDAELEERYLRGRSHDFPFLSPVSKAHGYGCPHVQRAYNATCAVGVSGCAGRSEVES
ncbi:hypothetical protein BDM02DRAFT_3008899 [Thelephora ganbajun]|uniref:Uncharacterized protein n=1 Tax=Thelephora ganbajun TaxID=370292 RepID=A0ACB6ZA92_THEGA|nr:hypothetical protein BDM02DRAFT_3008899 [Thelephora ganbajun]